MVSIMYTTTGRTAPYSYAECAQSTRAASCETVCASHTRPRFVDFAVQHSKPVGFILQERAKLAPTGMLEPTLATIARTTEHLNILSIGGATRSPCKDMVKFQYNTATASLANPCITLQDRSPDRFQNISSSACSRKVILRHSSVSERTSYTGSSSLGYLETLNQRWELHARCKQFSHLNNLRWRQFPHSHVMACESTHGLGMCQVLFVRRPHQVGNTVIGFVEVVMVNLRKGRRIREKVLSNKAMRGNGLLFASSAQRIDDISICIQAWLDNASHDGTQLAPPHTNKSVKTSHTTNTTHIIDSFVVTNSYPLFKHVRLSIHKVAGISQSLQMLATGAVFDPIAIREHRHHFTPSRLACSRIITSSRAVMLMPDLSASSRKSRLASGVRRRLVACGFSIPQLYHTFAVHYNILPFQGNGHSSPRFSGVALARLFRKA